MADNSDNIVKWALTGKIMDGPTLAATGKISVDSYNVINISVPAKTKGKTAKLPQGDGKICLMQIKAADDSLYPYLSYELEYESKDKKPGEKFFGDSPLMFIGPAVELIEPPKSITIWYNPKTPATLGPDCKPPVVPDAAITILIGYTSSAEEE